MGTRLRSWFWHGASADITQFTATTTLEVEQAITQIRDGGYDIAVMSMGAFDGPFDGTHSTTERYAELPAYSGEFSRLSPNAARRHWTDSNGDRYHEWAAGITDGVEPDRGRVRAYLSWYQTGGTTTSHDYDLVLEDTSGTQVPLECHQNGDDPPAERLIAFVPADGVYNLRIRAMSPVSIPLNDHFQLFLPNVNVEGTLQVSEHSLAVPAEASGSFTVGATRGSLLTPEGLDVRPIDGIEGFGSRGPRSPGC